MHGDIILVGKFVRMVVMSYRLQRPVWTTNPKVLYSNFRQSTAVVPWLIIIVVIMCITLECV